MKLFVAKILAFSLFALSAQAETVSIAFSGAEDIKRNSEYAFIKAFSDHLNANGIDTIVHPSNSVGKEKERFDQTVQGLLHVNFADSAMLFKPAPAMKATVLPFLFNGNEDFDAIIGKVDLIDKVNTDLVDHGVRLVAFPLRGAQAGVFNTNRPITAMEDMQALRIRAKDKVQVNIFGAWGVKTTVVDFSEIANALQTGVVEGYVNPPEVPLLFGHTDILKHFTQLNAAPAVRSLIVSEDWYAGLDANTRKIIDEGLEKGRAANRAWVTASAAKSEEALKAKGVTVTTLKPGERARFVKASEPLWKAFVGEDMVALLQSARSSN